MKLNELCDICGTKKPEVYCENCIRNHLYCEDCFEFVHKSDEKKAHIKQPFDKAENSTISCSDHPKKLLEFACIKCGVLTCGECIVIGKHRGHPGGTIKEAFKKFSSRYESQIKEYEAYIDLTTEYQKNPMNVVEKKLKLMKGLEQELNEDYNKLTEASKAVYERFSNLITRKINEYTEYKESFNDISTIFKSAIEECNIIIEKNELNTKDYSNFFKQAKRLDNVASKYYSWNLSPNRVVGSYFKPTLKSAIEIVENVMLCNFNPYSHIVGLNHSSIIEQRRDKKILHHWVSEVGRCGGFKLIYKGSADGFEASDFHRHCENSKPTLTMILYLEAIILNPGKELTIQGIQMSLYIH